MKQNRNPFNDKRKPHGLWIYYLPDGNLWFKGHFINDIRHGYWMNNWTNKPETTFYLK